MYSIFHSTSFGAVHNHLTHKPGSSTNKWISMKRYNTFHAETMSTSSNFHIACISYKLMHRKKAQTFAEYWRMNYFINENSYISVQNWRYVRSQYVCQLLRSIIYNTRTHFLCVPFSNILSHRHAQVQPHTTTNKVSHKKLNYPNFHRLASGE